MEKIINMIFGSKIRTLQKDNKMLRTKRDILVEHNTLLNERIRKRNKEFNNDLNGRTLVIKNEFDKDLKEYKERECKSHDKIIERLIEKKVQFQKEKNDEYIKLYDDYTILKDKYVKLIKSNKKKQDVIIDKMLDTITKK